MFLKCIGVVLPLLELGRNTLSYSFFYFQCLPECLENSNDQETLKLLIQGCNNSHVNCVYFKHRTKLPHTEVHM